MSQEIPPPPPSPVTETGAVPTSAGESVPDGGESLSIKESTEQPKEPPRAKAKDLATVLKEKQRVRASELKAKAEAEELRAKLARYEEIEKETSLVKKAEKLGLKYSDLTKEILATPQDQTQTRIQELEQKLAERERREQEAIAQAEEAKGKAVLADAQRQLTKELDESPDYPLLQKFGLTEHVVQRFTAMLMAGDRSLTPYQIAASFEADIEARIKAAADTPKLRQMLAAIMTPANEAGGEKHEAKASKTLTNALAAPRSPEKQPQNRVKSFIEDDNVANALRLFGGK